MTEEIKENEWEEVPDAPMKGFWKPQVGESIVGEIAGFTDGIYGQECHVVTPAGEPTKLPAHKQLQAKLGSIPDPVGKQICVTRIADQPSGKGFPTMMYRVRTKPKPKEDFPQPVETYAQKQARALAGIGMIGVHDSRILDYLVSFFENKEQAEFVFGMMKQSGMIMQKPDGCWRRV
jgi:hypothetical protein